ncbi:MAG: EAL domain-containing protein [Hyphomicrobiaceae bacterium]|nr:EAL domain-containing protein [Hyphomicrobiaceae bacterium]
MPGSQFTSALRKHARLVAGVVAVGGVLAVFALYMHHERASAIDRSRKELQGLAFALSEHLEDLVRSVDATLVRLADRSVHCQSIGILSTPDALSEAHRALRGVQSLNVLDAGGQVILTTWQEVRGMDRSRSSLLRTLQHMDATQTVVGAPFQSTTTGKVMLPIGRRLETGGKYCGALVALIEPERLSPIYLSLNGGGGRTIWLMQNAKVVARFGGDDGRAVPQIPEVGIGFDIFNSRIDGEPQMVAYDSVGESSLMIAASVPISKVLADWRRDLVVGIGFLMAIAGVASLLLRMQHREQQLSATRDAELMRQSEARRILFETSVDAILVLSEDKRVVQASPSVGTALGIAPEALIGQPLSEILRSEEARSIEAGLAQASNGRGLRGLETRLTSASGRSRWLSWSIVWSEGARKYFLIGHDRTDVKLREQLLVDRNRQLDAALENMSQGLAMFDKDERLIVANDKFALMYGQKPDELKPGTTLAELIAHRIRAGVYTESDPSELLQKMRERVATGSTSHLIRKTGDGRTLAVSIQPQPGGGWVATHLDISDTASLRDRLDAALDHMVQGLAMFDADFKLVLCNQRYLELYGLPPEMGRPGTSAREIVDYCVESGVYAGRDGEAIFNGTRKRISESRSGYFETRLSDGRIYGVSFRPMNDGGVVMTHDDISERRRIEAKIAHLAHHDALTDLANRALLRDRLRDDFAAQRSLAVLYLDLDRFKAVNDTLGHNVGDSLLRAVAERLRSSLREGDLVARLGGDEFAIVHCSGDLRTTATAIASRVVAALNAPFDVDGHTLSIGTSIGIAIAPADGGDPEQILKSADLALYAAKTERRGTHSFFDPSMNERLLATQVLELEMRSALANNEFFLEYQPICDLETGEVMACEALLRWSHPRKGRVPPADFIPLAEQTGLINEIGAWVLHEACNEAARWPEHIKIAVNLSPVQVRGQGLVAVVQSALDASWLTPSRLELEITETTLLGDNDHTLKVLGELYNLGPRIALDDFGTGYSSLSYLQMFPFNKIKVDRSFILAVQEGNPTSHAILRTVAFLGQALGMLTTVEGIETEEQIAYLRQEKFDQGQGYYFSRPVAAEALPWRARTEVA